MTGGMVSILDEDIDGLIGLDNIVYNISRERSVPGCNHMPCVPSVPIFSNCKTVPSVELPKSFVSKAHHPEELIWGRIFHITILLEPSIFPGAGIFSTSPTVLPLHSFLLLWACLLPTPLDMLSTPA